MKHIILILLCFSITKVAAQDLSHNMKKALKTDDLELFKSELIAAKISVDSCILIEEKRYPLLAICVKTNCTKILNALILSKADVNKICDDKSPLMFAAKYGRLDMAKALIAAGANLNLKNSENKTAIDYALKYEQEELINYFEKIKR